MRGEVKETRDLDRNSRSTSIRKVPLNIETSSVLQPVFTVDRRKHSSSKKYFRSQDHHEVVLPNDHISSPIEPIIEQKSSSYPHPSTSDEVDLKFSHAEAQNSNPPQLSVSRTSHDTRNFTKNNEQLLLPMEVAAKVGTTSHSQSKPTASAAPKLNLGSSASVMTMSRHAHNNSSQLHKVKLEISTLLSQGRTAEHSELQPCRKLQSKGAIKESGAEAYFTRDYKPKKECFARSKRTSKHVFETTEEIAIKEEQRGSHGLLNTFVRPNSTKCSREGKQIEVGKNFDLKRGCFDKKYSNNVKLLESEDLDVGVSQSSKKSRYSQKRNHSNTKLMSPTNAKSNGEIIISSFFDSSIGNHRTSKFTSGYLASAANQDHTSFPGKDSNRKRFIPLKTPLPQDFSRTLNQDTKVLNSQPYVTNSFHHPCKKPNLFRSNAICTNVKNYYVQEPKPEISVDAISKSELSPKGPGHIVKLYQPSVVKEKKTLFSNVQPPSQQTINQRTFDAPQSLLQKTRSKQSLTMKESLLLFSTIRQLNRKDAFKTIDYLQSMIRGNSPIKPLATLLKSDPSLANGQLRPESSTTVNIPQALLQKNFNKICPS